MGIDPGLSRCGYACLERQRGVSRAKPVTVGVITTAPADPLPARLAELQHELRDLFAEHPPDVVAIEQVFFQVNVRTAISVAHAAGVVMAEAHDANAEVALYTPNQVKEAVAGWGGAGKGEVERMAQTLLGTTQPLRPVDAADAVALALCHLAHAPRQRAVTKASTP